MTSYYLWNTLGMSGQWTTKNDKHSHVLFKFGEGIDLYFRDVRNFGTLKFIENRSEMQKKLKTIGHDILDPISLPEIEVIKLFRLKPKWTLPKFVMDQKYLSGVGNYLKSEALYCSKLSPHREIQNLTNPEIISIYQSLRRIAMESYKNKGASFLTFVDPDSNKGKYSFCFLIYGKEEINNEKVVREKTLDGRTTHWLPSQQF